MEKDIAAAVLGDPVFPVHEHAFCEKQPLLSAGLSVLLSGRGLGIDLLVSQVRKGSEPADMLRNRNCYDRRYPYLVRILYENRIRAEAFPR